MFDIFLQLLKAPLEMMRVAQGDKRYVDAPLFPQTHDAANELALMAHGVAISELGNGETEGNNKGPDIRRYCAPNSDGYEWCAAFAGFCYETAAKKLNVSMPFKRSLGARNLGANVALVGRKFLAVEEALPGDLIIWPRFATPGDTVHGHVNMFESYDGAGIITCIDGNSGPKVRYTERALKKEKPVFFASIRLHAPGKAPT